MEGFLHHHGCVVASSSKHYTGVGIYTQPERERETTSEQSQTLSWFIVAGEISLERQNLAHRGRRRKCLIFCCDSAIQAGLGCLAGFGPTGRLVGRLAGWLAAARAELREIWDQITFATNLGPWGGCIKREDSLLLLHCFAFSRLFSLKKCRSFFLFLFFMIVFTKWKQTKNFFLGFFLKQKRIETFFESF